MERKRKIMPQPGFDKMNAHMMHRFSLGLLFGVPDQALGITKTLGRKPQSIDIVIPERYEPVL